MSSKPQGRDDRYGPRTQSLVAEYATQRLGLVPIGQFEDHVTGTSAQRRHEFNRMNQAALAVGREGVVLAYDVSRWARDEKDGWTFIEELKRGRVPVYFVHDDLLAGAGGDANWRDRFGGLINSASKQSRDISAKVRAANGVKWRSGGWHGTPPFGYRRAVVRNPQKFAVQSILPDPRTIRKRIAIFKIWNAGKCKDLWALSAECAKRGILNGTVPFTSSGLALILNSDVVLGTLKYQPTKGRDDEDKPAALVRHEEALIPRDASGRPLLTERDVVAARKRLVSHRIKYVRSKAGRPAIHEYVFKTPGCMKCEGGGFFAHTTTSGYRRQVHTREHGCRRMLVRGEDLMERTLAGWFKTFQLPDDFVARIAAVGTKAQPAADPDMGRRRRDIEGRLRAYRKQLDAGRLMSEIGLRYEALQLELASLALPPVNVVTRTAIDPAQVGMIHQVLSRFREQPIPRRAELVAELFEKVWFGDNGRLKVRVSPRYVALVRIATGEIKTSNRVEWIVEPKRAKHYRTTAKLRTPALHKTVRVPSTARRGLRTSSASAA